MDILIAFFFLSSMASQVIGAPLTTRNSTLVADPRFQELVDLSRSLTQKILLAVPDTHESCVHTETLKLNSTDNAKLSSMAAIIRIPSAPVVKVMSENVTLEHSLKQMYEGLQVQRATLSSVSPKLDNNQKVMELMADIRDLAIQINKMLQMAQSAAVQPSPSPVSLHLPGQYEVQVAAHLALVQLQSFSRDMIRCLRVLDQSNDEEPQS